MNSKSNESYFLSTKGSSIGIHILTPNVHKLRHYPIMVEPIAHLACFNLVSSDFV